MARKSKKSSAVTPKGVAWLAIRDSGVNITANSPEFHAFWDKFTSLLTQHGYTLPGEPAVELQDDNFGTVLNCAVRYAVGRRTYMPSIVIGYITPLLPQLSSKTLWCFDQDVTDAKYTGGYGDPCDEKDWLRFLEAVRTERTKRGEELYKSHWEGTKE